MNIRKGFFRITLVLSVLCGILTLIYSDDIFGDAILGFGRRSRDITIMIPLPNDWESKPLKQKLNSIDELLIFKKKDEKRKESSSVEEALEGFRKAMSLNDYSKLTPREQQNVKRRLREQIIFDDKKTPKDKERRNYYVSSGPDWRELGFLVFFGFTIGFVPVWLIYAFTKWAVLGFIAGGFKGKSLEEGEP